MPCEKCVCNSGQRTLSQVGNPAATSEARPGLNGGRDPFDPTPRLLTRCVTIEPSEAIPQPRHRTTLPGEASTTTAALPSSRGTQRRQSSRALASTTSGASASSGPNTAQWRLKLSTTTKDQSMTTAAPIHPGEHLAEYLGELGITQYRLAKTIGVPQVRISDIVDSRALNHRRQRPENRKSARNHPRVLAQTSNESTTSTPPARQPISTTSCRSSTPPSEINHQGPLLLWGAAAGPVTGMKRGLGGVAERGPASYPRAATESSG